MRHCQANPREQQGSATIIGIMLLVVVIVYMLQTTLNISDSSIESTRLQESGIDALYLAESGLERAARRFSDNTALCAANGLGEANVELVVGSGRQFTIISDATGLPANQCRLTVTGQVAANNASRTVQAVVNAVAGTGVTFDSTSNLARNNQDTVSWTHTVGVGANRLLLVGISTGPNRTVTSVTSNGTAMNLVASQTNFGARAELYQLINPASGNNTISITLDDRGQTVAGAISFSGVDQTDPLENPPATFTNAGWGNNASLDITTVTNNAWAIAVISARTGNVPTIGAGETEQWNARIGPGFARMQGAGSTFGPQSPAGTVTMDWSGLGFITPWAMVGAAVKPGGNNAASVVTWTEVVQ